MKPLKKAVLFFLFIGLTSAVFPKNDAIRADIKGIGNDTILIQYMPISKMYEMKRPLTDTIYSKKNKFSYNLPAPYSTDTMFVFLYPTRGDIMGSNGKPYHCVRKKIMLILLPGEQLNLKGVLTDYYLDYNVSGSKINEDYSRLYSQFIQQVGENVKIDMQLDSLLSKQGNRDQIKVNQLLEAIEKNSQPERGAQLQFIKENLDNQLAAYYLLAQPLDTFALYADKLTKEVQTGIFKNMFDLMYNRIQISNQAKAAKTGVQIPQKAPDFTLTSITGKPLTLSTVKKKFVVLDFWGSWCSWCIKGFPDMKKYYEKYSDQFEIIGIDCNDTEAAWKKAVADNQLKWLHVVNNTASNQDVVVKYGISGFPTKVILDENKYILAVIVGESPEFYNKLDELMGNK